MNNQYEESVKAISVALEIGIIVEELDVTVQLLSHDIATWLASEGIGQLPKPSGTHPVLEHRNGDKCVWMDGMWFVPLDAGGEGYECNNADHNEIGKEK